jgi:mannose-1-phosphate guanylyltransferase
MKAIILAGGLGTRLRPLTDTVPKCLVEVCGKPILEWWFDLLSRNGVTEFLINTHHLPELVEAFVAKKSIEYNLLPTIFREKELLGSLGTLLANRDYFQNQQDFLVVYADVLTDLNLSELLAFHRSRHSRLTIGLVRMPNPESRGIVTINDAGLVESFIEKPKQPKSNLANGGVYVMTPEVIPAANPSNAEILDIGKHLLQMATPDSNYYALEFDCYLRDIGTLESLKLAQLEWSGLKAGKLT